MHDSRGTGGRNQARRDPHAPGGEARSRIDDARERISDRAKAVVWQQMSEGVIVVDLEGRIVECNPGAGANFGYPREELVGMHVTRLIAEAVPGTYRHSVVAHVMRDGRWEDEVVLRRRDGCEIVCEISVIALRDEAGGLVGTVGINRDITERKRHQEEILAAKEEAEQAARMAEAMMIEAKEASNAKSQFLQNMSHELRTPLNAVIGFSEILKDDTFGAMDAAERREYARDIHQAGNQLLALINGILDLSKVEAGKLELDTVDFDLTEVIEGLSPLMKPRVDEKGLDLWTFVPPDAPTRLSGDPVRLRQVLLNLVDNAVKFTDRGVVSVEAAVAAQDETGVLYRFEVTDTGCGIAEDVRQRLFTMFSQADASTTRRFGGTGLGLAICRELCVLMAGEIGVESAPGRGSTFWFTARFGRAAQIGAGVPATADLNDLRALVVDDTAVNRRLFRRQLRSWGMVVSEAADGPAALAALADAAGDGAPFHVVLIDHVMPGMDGIELARRIRRAPGGEATRLIMVSSGDVAPSATGAEEAAWDGWLQKPVVQSALFDHLAALFGPGRRPRRLRILVAEDNPADERLVARLLARAGHRVEVAFNGLEAVIAVATGGYDLVLMDLEMPEMDGITATRNIRALEGAMASVPIIAHAAQDERERCLAAGMDDHVSKPIDPARLEAAIARRCGGSDPDRQRSAQRVRSGG